MCLLRQGGSRDGKVRCVCVCVCVVCVCVCVCGGGVGLAGDMRVCDMKRLCTHGCMAWRMAV